MVLQLIFIELSEFCLCDVVYLLKVNKAVQIRKEKKQWIDLGDMSLACITDPVTCVHGATLTAWIKIDECAQSAGIISGQRHRKRGFKLKCEVTDNMR